MRGTEGNPQERHFSEIIIMIIIMMMIIMMMIFIMMTKMILITTNVRSRSWEDAPMVPPPSRVSRTWYGIQIR